MEINILEDYLKLSESVADEILLLIQQKKNAILCFPSGDTPLGLFKVLIERNRLKSVDFSTCTFTGLDEWRGMDQYDDGSCKNYVYNKLFIPLGIKSGQIHFFDAKSSNLVEECNRTDSVIKKLGGADIMVPGIGMNGHLGLNEPGVNPNLYAHIAELNS